MRHQYGGGDARSTPRAPGSNGNRRACENQLRGAAPRSAARHSERSGNGFAVAVVIPSDARDPGVCSPHKTRRRKPEPRSLASLEMTSISAAALLSCPRNKQFHRRLHSIHRGETSLIHRQSEMSPRVDIEQRLPQCHVAESAHELDLHLFWADLHRNLLPALVSQLHKIVRIQIRYQVPKRTVGRDHLRYNSPLVELRGPYIQVNEQCNRHLGANFPPFVSASEVRSHGRKNVAP